MVRAALAHGKHVYTEKPLATSVADAREPRRRAAERGLRLGCAPDTFLGSAYEAGRELIERGAIGEPLGATAAMLVGGPDGWHPNADIFYRAGGGPMLDLGPYYLTAVASLLGPFVAATGFASTPTPVRRLARRAARGRGVHGRRADARRGAPAARARPARDAHRELRGDGAVRDDVVVHGTEGSLRFPTRTTSTATSSSGTGADEWTTVAYESRGARETRGLGLHEMLEAMANGQPHRASGQLGLHVLEMPTRCCARRKSVAPFRLPPDYGDVRTRAWRGGPVRVRRAGTLPSASLPVDSGGPRSGGLVSPKIEGRPRELGTEFGTDLNGSPRNVSGRKPGRNPASVARRTFIGRPSKPGPASVTPGCLRVTRSLAAP